MTAGFESIKDDLMGTLVSINCITYNHEKFIVQALDGFLSQQTNFAYEILIHDDASTDRTADIVKEYASKYPGLIKPILQTENQYSQGIRVGAVFNYPRACGKYIASCEGDDFWTDPMKLQQQVDYMEANPDCSLCFHAVEIVDPAGNSIGNMVKPYPSSQLVPIEDLILGVGEYHRTCSLMARAEYLHKMPDFFYQAPAGDLALILYLASQGSVYYLDKVMSAYRTGVEGSWTSRLNQSAAQQIKVRTGLLKMFAEFDHFTGYEFTEAVAKRLHRTKFLILLAQGDVNALKAQEYKQYRDQISKFLLAKVYLKTEFPAIYKHLHRLFRK